MTKIIDKSGNEIYVAKRIGDLRQAVQDAVTSGISLSGASLSGVDLGEKFVPLEQKWGKLAIKSKHQMFVRDRNGAVLVSAELSGADLTNARLEGVNLTSADLTGANLVQAHLNGATLVRANLVGGNLTGAMAGDADLSGANLSGVDLTAGQLTLANLAAVNLSDAKLIGANFYCANLASASFVGANLTGACFIHAQLEGANLNKVNLAYLSFRGANLKGANLNGANLAYTDFTGANLTGADMSNTRLGTAIFTDADLANANFSGATLPTGGIKTRVALEMPPFLSDKVMHGGQFKPPQVRSTRVPFAELPEPMYSTTFLIEKVESSYYLRNTLDSYYCTCLRICTHQVSLPRFDKETGLYEVDKETGEQIVDEAKLILFLAYFDGSARTVGYYIDGELDMFLPFFETDKKHKELGKCLASLYNGARIGTLRGMRYMENILSEQRVAENEINHPQPRDEWAASMFRNVFGSNPKLMSDSEYEMIFGIER